jgi:chromate transporter
LRLGLTSFGGPVAHLGYFERTYVQQLKWLTHHEYADIVAVAQLMPGPASSQTGFLIGLRRAGWPGAAAAFAGFTLPSAILMLGFACIVTSLASPTWSAVLHGLQLTAVVVVAQAVFSMFVRLCPDVVRRGIAACTCIIAIFAPAQLGQWSALIVGAIAGALWCPALPLSGLRFPVNYRVAIAALAVFLAALVFSLLAPAAWPRTAAAFVASFYQAGALVFGGGHVVLPLLRDALVPVGYIGDGPFLAGYGVAQALPGPLFAFGAYLGAASNPPGGTLAMGCITLIALFLPGLLLAVAGAGLSEAVARTPRAGSVLAGVNAAVVGVLAAALYAPVWVSAAPDLPDVLVIAATYAGFQSRQLTPWMVVATCVTISVVRVAAT